MNSVGATGSNPSGLAFRAWRLATILPAVLLVCCTCAFPLDPSLDISQYAHTAWKVREGFTRGYVNAIAQTPDGYLWLATEMGLVRFDGVRAVPWGPPVGQWLPDNFIGSLLAHATELCGSALVGDLQAGRAGSLPPTRNSAANQLRA